MRLISFQLSKNGVHIDRDALAIGPGCVPIQINIFGGFDGRHAHLVAFFSFSINVFEITFHLSYTLFIGNGTVPRHNDIHIHLKYAITSSQPVAGWTGPNDGMATDKQDIGCEYNPVSRDMDKCIAKSVSRPNLDEMDFLVSYFQC